MTNPYAPPRAEIRDIVDLSQEIVPAGRGIRLGAMIIDSIVFAAMVYLPLLVGIIVGGLIGKVVGKEQGGLLAGSAVLALLGFIVWCRLTISYVKQNGQTIAKKLLGIKVVRVDGSPISLGRIFWLRNVVNGLLSFIPFYGFIDALFIFGESRQCLHDKLADTIVIQA